MAEAFTVRQFIQRGYRLINASSPVVPLHGDDESLALGVMNQLMKHYASSGLMMTIAKTVSVSVNLPQNQILFTNPDYPLTTSFNASVILTLGSPNFLVPDSSIYFPGDTITGVGVPPSTYILGITGNTITMSANATIGAGTIITVTHDISDPTVAYIMQGRLSNLDSAWLLLSGVTYPLIDKSRDEYLAAWKYEPLQGLPRFIITFPDTNVVSAKLYPAPSQFYQFYARGKFQITSFSINDDMSDLPEYYQLYFMYAVFRQVARFKGRSEAWTPDLEALYQELREDMEGASEINLSIAGDEQSLLNGAWRVRAGI